MRCFDVLPGTYTITVTDANGCISTANPIIRRLKSKIDGVAELRCDHRCYCGFYNRRYTNPLYTVNGGTATALGTSATGFTYTAPSDGTYTFVITDADMEVLLFSSVAMIE
jgi:hypothetical protein